MHSPDVQNFNAKFDQLLAGFRKGIRREETAYPKLKDERYFDGFSRSLCVTAKPHEYDQVLDTDNVPIESEKELFAPK